MCKWGRRSIAIFVNILEHNTYVDTIHVHTYKHNTHTQPLHTHLYLPWYTGGLHPTGHVDCVPPYVILGLLSSNHPRHQRPMVDTLGREQQILSKEKLEPTYRDPLSVMTSDAATQCTLSKHPKCFTAYECCHTNGLESMELHKQYNILTNSEFEALE